MVEVVLRHWISMVTATEGVADPVTEGFGQYIQWMGAYFYSDDGLLASMRETQLQQAFNILTEMFVRVGLRTNVGNMVSMALHPY